MAKFKDLYPSALSGVAFDISISPIPIPKFIAISNCNLSVISILTPKPKGITIELDLSFFTLSIVVETPNL